MPDKGGWIPSSTYQPGNNASGQGRVVSIQSAPIKQEYKRTREGGVYSVCTNKEIMLDKAGWSPFSPNQLGKNASGQGKV